MGLAPEKASRIRTMQVRVINRYTLGREHRAVLD